MSIKKYRSYFTTSKHDYRVLGIKRLQGISVSRITRLQSIRISGITRLQSIRVSGITSYIQDIRNYKTTGTILRERNMFVDEQINTCNSL